MKTGRISFIVIGVVICFLVILYRNFLKDVLVSNKYGKSANVIRDRTKIPVIESNMRRERGVSGTEGAKWERKDIKKGIIHIWKIVTPNSNNYILYEELDMFRQYIDSETYWQLNMSSKIAGDSVSIRTGTLRFYDNVLVKEYDVDDDGLDSLFSSWQLYNLVKE